MREATLKSIAKLLRTGEGRKLRALRTLTDAVNELAGEIAALDDAALAAKTGEFRARLAGGEDLADVVVEAFAVAREASERVLGMRPYDEQIMGGFALHLGWVAEMGTGQGKTLAAVAPAYANALTGAGVHVVTVNDYLAARDAEQMGRIHRFLGLSVGVVTSDTPHGPERRAQYDTDVTYATNTELGFDYLRDNLVTVARDRVARGRHYAIVDEADSILIDEARTPMIISGAGEAHAADWVRYAQLVARLDTDAFEVDEAAHSVTFTDDGLSQVDALLGRDDIWGDGERPGDVAVIHHLFAALQARTLYVRDRDYVVTDDGKVAIIDENTGRMLDGRRWENGLHQAIEAKEGVEIEAPTRTHASVSIQMFFKLYDKLAGMTGTASTDAAELNATYDLDVVTIPPHQTSRRVDHDDVIYLSRDAKLDAVVDDIERRHVAGQPVLVGTTSVLASEELAGRLTEAGVPHVVLNAKEHRQEAVIIAQAGRPGAVTVATNMAGRGVDILLGGNPEQLALAELHDKGHAEAASDWVQLHDETVTLHRIQCEMDAAKVRAAGGLYVIGTERHESRRIDNQLRGRSGRQGDPGETRFYLSLEDDLVRRFLPDTAAGLWARALPPDVPIEAKVASRAVERAQTSVEGRNASARAEVARYDEVLDVQRKTVYELRDAVLDGTDVHDTVVADLAEVIDGLVAAHLTDIDADDDRDGFAQLAEAVVDLWPVTLTGDDLEHVFEVAGGDLDAVTTALGDDALAHWSRRAERYGAAAWRHVEAYVTLGTLDAAWVNHREAMDHLLDGIHLRQVGQQNPLTTFTREGFALFNDMLDEFCWARIKHLSYMPIQDNRDDIDTPVNVGMGTMSSDEAAESI